MSRRFINVVTVTPWHINYMALFIHSLACFAFRLYDMQVSSMTERTFSKLETDTKT